MNFDHNVSLFILSSLTLLSCTDPVAPEFELKEGLVFVEGIVSTEPGASFVSINRSTIEFGQYIIAEVENATVQYLNQGSGSKVALLEVESGTYVPQRDFKVSSGEMWKLTIQLPNGKRYESFPEIVTEAVPIDEILAAYETELEYREIDGGRFVPGHRVSVSFEDKPNEENYYYWTYTTHEKLFWCEKCVQAYFRNGACIPLPQEVFGRWVFDYVCDSDCWRIRYPDKIALFDDKFSDGKAVVDFPIANIPLYTKENMVITAQQLMLSKEAYEYYEILEDIVENNSGLNAPPPAGLIGNMFNPDDDEEFVFGRFTAAATSTKSIFIDRSEIEENPIEVRGPTYYEEEGAPVPQPLTGAAPCAEGRYRTGIRPPGWIDR